MSSMRMNLDNESTYLSLCASHIPAGETSNSCSVCTAGKATSLSIPCFTTERFREIKLESGEPINKALSAAEE
jgi:hypothetical protein